VTEDYVVRYDPREPEAAEMQRSALIRSLGLVAHRAAAPTLADTVHGVGLWHLAHVHEARTHVVLTGHLVSVIVTPIPPHGEPTAARTVKFAAPATAAEVAAALDPLLGA
jgi:hypothetical protein